jgi:hypothetical protein
MELEILAVFKITCHVFSFVYMYNKGKDGNPLEFSSDTYSHVEVDRRLASYWKRMAETNLILLNISHQATQALFTKLLRPQLVNKLLRPQLVNKFPTFYGTPRLITVLNEPATGPYPEPYKSRPRSATRFL